METHNHKTLIQSFSPDSFGFTSFKNNENFVTWYNANGTADMNLCELIKPKDSVKLYFDLDGYMNIENRDEKALHGHCDVVLGQFISLVQDEIKSTFGEGMDLSFQAVDDCRMKFVESMGKEYFKLSFHLLFGGAIFKTNKACEGFIMDKILSNTRFTDNTLFFKIVFRNGVEKESMIVDTMVYSSYRAMRIAGSKKWGEGDANGPITQLSTDLMIVVEDVAAPIEYQSTVANIGVNRRAVVPLINNTPRDESRDDADYAQLLELLRSKGDLFSTLQQTNDNSFYVRTTTQGRNCLVTTGSVHHSNNAMFYVAEDRRSVVYKCFSAECQRGFARFPFRGGSSEYPLCLNVNVKPDTPYVDADINFPERCLVLAAPMGSGKTIYVAKYLAEHKFKSFLFITTRVSLANSLMDSFKKVENTLAMPGFFDNVKLYTDSSVKIGGEIKHPYLVCQYESLWRLQQSYDCVIVDEIRSLTTNMVSTSTNGVHIAENFEMFELLMKSAHKVLMMDADFFIDDAAALLVKHLFINRFQSVRSEVYKHSNLPRDMCVYPNKEAFLSVLYDYVNKGKRIACCMGSKLDTDVLCRMFAEDNITYKSYTSDTDDVDMRTDLKEVETIWCQPQVIIYTSKILVGTDYNGHIDAVFAWGNRISITPRELFQMTGRLRRPVENTIHLYCDHSGTMEEHLSQKMCYESINEAVDHVIAKRKQNKKHFNDCLDIIATEQKFVMEDGTIGWTPHLATMINAYIHMERVNSQNNWMGMCLRLAKAKDYAYSVATDIPLFKIDGRYKGHLLEEKKDRQEVMGDMAAKINETPDIVPYALKMVRKGEASVEDKQTATVYNLIRCFKSDDGNFVSDADIIKYIEKNVSQIKMYYAWQRLNTEQLVLMDIQKGKDIAWADQYIPRSLTLRVLDNISELMGYNSLGELVVGLEDLCGHWLTEKIVVAPDKWLALFNQMKTSSKKKILTLEDFAALDNRSTMFFFKSLICEHLPMASKPAKRAACCYQTERHRHYKFSYHATFLKLRDGYNTDMSNPVLFDDVVNIDRNKCFKRRVEGVAVPVVGDAPAFKKRQLLADGSLSSVVNIQSTLN
jgi:hypothetical protein